MAAVTEADSSLAFKCMAFCQALASQGQAFSFSLSIGQDFSFSLDSKSKASRYPETKKKVSPSTIRRNAKRREEFKKKQGAHAQIDENAVNAILVIKCDLCEYKAASVKGLKQHVRMKHHKPSPLLATPESLRRQGLMRPVLNTSPLSLSSRDENCHNCGGSFSPSHQCDGAENGDEEGVRTDDQAGEDICTCDCPLPICCVCLHDRKCTCYKEYPDSSICSCEARC